MEEPLLARGSPEGVARPSDLRDNQIRITIDETMQTLLEETNRNRNRCRTYISTEPISRCWNSTKFCLLFTASATTAAAPDALALIEACTMLLVYFIAVPDAIWNIHQHHGIHHKTYAFNHSTEDIISFSILRAVTIWLAHRVLPISSFQWHYLIFNILIACITVPYASVKLYAIVHSGWEARHRAPAVALCALLIVFSIGHVLAVQSVIAWTKRRERLGLSTHSIFYLEMCFIGKDVTVHYKIAFPVTNGREEGQQGVPLTSNINQNWSGAGAAGFQGVVLIHSFGGGVHSWRHVLQPLADQSGVAVIAFDRPGFGLTSRPLIPLSKSGGENFLKSIPVAAPPAASMASQSSPYSMEYSAWIPVELALHLGLQKVVFVGTGDGALVALMATQLANLLKNNTTITIPTATGPAAAADHGGPALTETTTTIDNISTATAIAAISGTSIPSNSSLPASLDLTWMGSAAAPVDRREILRRLLRGEFTPFDTPASGGGSDIINSAHHPVALEQQLILNLPPPDDQSQNLPCPCPPLPPPGHLATNSVEDIIDSEILLLEEEEENSNTLDTGHHRPFSRESTRSEKDIEFVPAPATATAPSPPPLDVSGVALVNMDMSGQCGPTHIRVLGSSKLGRHVLRDLLASEVGDVGNSRAWSATSFSIGGGLGGGGSSINRDKYIAISSAPPPIEVMALYKQYLQVGPLWDAALVEVCRAAGKLRKLSQRRLGILLEAALGDDTGLLVVHGGDDALVKVDDVKSMMERMSDSGGRRARKHQLEVLVGCGHLAHEEQPLALVAVLARFVRDVL